MFSKHVKYKDYSGEDREVTLYFNLSKAEIAEMEMNESKMAADGGVTGGLEEKLNTIQKGGNGAEILAAFKDIIFMSYGKRVYDEDLGEIFDKSAEISRKFERSGAYEEFFMWLIGSEENAAKFVNGAMPADFQKPRDQDKPDPSRRPGRDNLKAVEETPQSAPAPQDDYQGRPPTAEELRMFRERQQQERDDR